MNSWPHVLGEEGGSKAALSYIHSTTVTLDAANNVLKLTICTNQPWKWFPSSLSSVSYLQSVKSGKTKTNNKYNPRVQWQRLYSEPTGMRASI